MTKPRRHLGPQPLPPAPALDGVRGQVLRELTRRARPVDVATLTARLGGHPNTIRGHLDVLTAGGLASCTPQPSSTRGRPALGYAVTPAGRTAYRMHVAGGPVGAEDVTEALVAYLAGRADGPAKARDFGRHWGATLAGAGDGPVVGSAVELVTATLARMGFSPETAPAGPGSAGELRLRLVTCPLLDAAREQPDVVCGIHQGLLEGLLERQTDDRKGQSVTLAPFAEPGACVVTLTA